MRIVHFICALLGNGGAENMLIDLANCQAERDHVMVVVANDPVSPELLAGFDSRIGVSCLNRPQSSRNPVYLAKLLRAISGFGPDIIHSHAEVLAALLPRRPAPAVATVHCTRIASPKRLRKYERVFAVSAAVADEVRRASGVAAAVVQNGICFDQVAVGPPPPPSPFRIVQVSRLDPADKGQDILLHAVAELRHRFGMHDVTVDFIGKGTARRELELLAERLGVQDSVRFEGDLRRRDVYSRLCSYNLLVQPSRCEGFGLTVVEGMAAGVPVLVSDSEGPMQIIADGAQGECFRTGDSSHCAEMIGKIRCDASLPGFRARLAAACSYARSQFDISVTARKYLEGYQAVLAVHA